MAATLNAEDLQLLAQVRYGVSGTVWHVKPTGNDTTGDGLTWATAYATIAKAVSVKASGDTILCSPGTHNVPAAVSLSNLRLFGAGRAATFVACTVLSGTRIVFTVGSNVVIEDMSITANNASGTTNPTIPLNMSSASNVTLNRLRVVGDTDTITGSGANVTINDCVFETGWDNVLIECALGVTAGWVINRTTFLNYQNSAASNYGGGGSNISFGGNDDFSDAPNAILNDCTIATYASVAHPSTANDGVVAYGGARITVNRGLIHNAGSLVTHVEVNTSGGSGTIDLNGVQYNTARVSGSPNVFGDVKGKVIGGGSSTIGAVGARVVDSGGNDVGGASAAAVWTYANRLLTDGSVRVATPYQTGRLTVVRGNSYSNADGNPITRTKGDEFTWPSDLASLPWTVKLYMDPTADTLARNSSAASLATGSGVTGTVVSATSVRFDLTATQTAALSLGAKNGAYAYTIIASKTGSKAWLLEQGVVDLVDDLITA